MWCNHEYCGDISDNEKQKVQVSSSVASNNATTYRLILGKLPELCQTSTEVDKEPTTEKPKDGKCVANNDLSSTAKVILLVTKSTSGNTVHPRTNLSGGIPSDVTVSKEEDLDESCRNMCNEDKTNNLKEKLRDNQKIVSMCEDGKVKRGRPRKRSACEEDQGILFL